MNILEQLARFIRSTHVGKRVALMLVARHERAVNRHIEMLQNGDSDMRLAAARALPLHEDKRAVQPLIAALQDSNEEVRYAAAKSLGNLGDTRAVAPLLEAFKKQDWAIRHFASQALIKLGEPAEIRLIAALKDDDKLVRMGAVETLSKINTMSTVLPLIEALKDIDATVRRQAAIALDSRRESWAFSALLDALKDEDNFVRYWACCALGKLEDARAVLPISDMLNDSDRTVHLAVVNALDSEDSVNRLPIKVLSSNHLSTEQKVESLFALERVRWKNSRIAPPRTADVIERYCRSILTMPRVELAALQGAQAVLIELDRRAYYASLLRPGQKNAEVEQKELLRAAASQPEEARSDELLRASIPDPTTGAIPQDHSVFVAGD